MDERLAQLVEQLETADADPMSSTIMPIRR
jgi:hypothetical protein